MTKFADLPRNERRWRIAAVFIGLVAIVVMVAPVLAIYLSRQRVAPLTHDFCVLQNGNPVFVDYGLGGSDLFLYDRKTKTRRIIVRTPDFEEEPSLSFDGRQIVCTFTDPRSSSRGLEIIDVATGKTQTYLRGRFDGMTRPVFSPSGRRVAFTHYGRGWDAPMQSSARRYLCELDLATGQVTDLVRRDEYYGIENPLYISDDQIVFTGEWPLDDRGRSKNVVAAYTRGSGIRNVDLPERAYLRLMAYSRGRDSFFALAQTNRGQDSQGAFIARKELNHPDAWRLMPVRCGYADYSPATQEILALSENPRADTINAVSLHNFKTSAIVRLTKPQ